MSGWPSQPFPPTRGHSRSRSPPHRYGGSNSGGGSGPDFGGPGGGWDDRGPYDRRDYRGRSRSPSGYDDARKRRRSPSPLWQRDRGDDRYEPRPRYQEDYDAHTRSRGYSPGRRFPPNNGRNRNMPDPYQMDSPASFKQFAEWFRHTYPRETGEDDIADKIAADAGEAKPKGMRVRYERYKKEFHCRQVQTLFDYHRKAPWFQERYDPAPVFENLRKRVRKRGWQGKVHQFLIDLEDGKYDPDLTTAIEPVSKPVGDAAPSDLVGDDKPASQAKDESDAKQEDEPMFDDEGDEARGRERARVTTGSDEISIPPEGNEVMIRTIAPDIGRIKLEEFLKTVPGFMYLALGEPMQKRNYYRAGWIRFENDADMEKVLAELSERKIDGFKLHVNHTKTPFITRVKNTPEIASRPDRIRADLENVKLLAAKLETEAAELRRWSEPPPQPANDSENANGDATENSNGDVQMSEAKTEPPAAPEEPEPEPAERGIDAVERRIAKLVDDLPKPEGEEAVEALETQKLAIALDLYVAYVRSAYNACFYCAAVVDHVEELHRKCAQHRRRPYVAPAPVPAAPPAAANPSPEAAKPEEEDRERERERDPRGLPERLPDRAVDRTDEQFVEKLEARIALLVRPDTVDPKDYGGKNLDEELAKLVEPHIKQEDEGKYRCKTCSKLFKATSFVEKHVANKHSELIKGVDEAELFNRFALDPQRIQPYTRIPAPSGSAQPLAPQAFGLQAPAYPPPDFNRGFMQPFNGGGFNNGFGEYPMNGGGFDRGRQFDYRPQRSPPMGRAGGDRFLGGPGGGGPGRGFDNRGPGGNGFGNGPAMGGRPRRDSDARGNGVPPPPPPDAKEDPRAAAGRKISYHDMDEVAEGDVELTY